MNLGAEGGCSGGACANPRLREESGGGGGAGGAGDADLSFAAGPGNLGEGSSPVDAAASGVERLTAQLERVLTSRNVGKGAKEESKEEDCDALIREEEERLRKQAGEEETVKRYLKRSLGRADKVRPLSCRCFFSPVPLLPPLSCFLLPIQLLPQFHKDLENLYDPSKAHLYPPIALLSSHSTATVRGVLSSSRERVAAEGVARLTWAEGDGIVLYESATRLPGDPEMRGEKRTGGVEDGWMGKLAGVVESGHGHVSLLGDLDAMKECLRLLYG
jgi:hypothetical protein